MAVKGYRMSKTIAIRLADGTFYPILSGTSAAKKTLTLTTVQDNQTIVQVDLYSGDSAIMENPEYVDTLQIDILPAHANGELDIAFSVALDEDGLLSANIFESESGSRSAVSVPVIREERLDMPFPDVNESGEDTFEGLDEDIAGFVSDIAADTLQAETTDSTDSGVQADTSDVQVDTPNAQADAETEIPEHTEQTSEESTVSEETSDDAFMDDMAEFGNDITEESEESPQAETSVASIDEMERELSAREATSLDYENANDETIPDDAGDSPSASSVEEEVAADETLGDDFTFPENNIPDDDLANPIQMPAVEEIPDTIPDIIIDTDENPLSAVAPPLVTVTEAEENMMLDESLQESAEQLLLRDLNPDKDGSAKAAQKEVDDEVEVEDEGEDEDAETEKPEVVETVTHIAIEKTPWGVFLPPIVICALCALVCLGVLAAFMFVAPARLKDTLGLTELLQSVSAVFPARELNNAVLPPAFPSAPPPASAGDDFILEESPVVYGEIQVAADPATVVPLPPTPPASMGIDINVTTGDTLWDISASYYQNPWMYRPVASYNGITDPDYVNSGTVVRLPPQ
ncbi:MAG: hypothetical protein Ta2A_11400 [Treponemataceae bacterium]|nr:MAG: hypothetical protein Ta2A_11400 [Treponemataceae bacterium]